MRAAEHPAVPNVPRPSSRPHSFTRWTSRGFRAIHESPIRCSLFAVLFFALSACTSDVIRETGTHPDGSPAFEREYRVTEDGRRVPHGWHSTWHPGGTRATLAYYRDGRRHGNVFEWDVSGALVALAVCDYDRCRDRRLHDATPRAAVALAGTRFSR